MMKESSQQSEANPQEKISQVIISIPSLLCPSAFPAKVLCTGKDCTSSNSLICQEQSCPSCPSIHYNCGQTAKLRYLTDMLEKKSDSERVFMRKVWNIEDSFINSIVDTTRRIIQKYYLSFFNEEEKTKVINVFQDKKKQPIQPHLALNILNKLKSSSLPQNKNQNQLLKKFQKEVRMLQCSLSRSLSQIFQGYYSNVKQEKMTERDSSQKNLERTAQKTVNPANPVNDINLIDITDSPPSKKTALKEKKLNFERKESVISRKLTLQEFNSPDKNDQEQSIQMEVTKPLPVYSQLSYILENSNIIASKFFNERKYIHEELLFPKRLELLFRASDNNYSSHKFHESCDYIPSTFTLVKTHSQNIFGGYTPLPWNKTQGFMEDKTSTSFLLSIDLRKKLPLRKNSTKAIWSQPGLGPSFGCKDIVIGNLCNLNGHCKNGFPESYSFQNQGEELFLNSPSITGVRKGESFRVKEYEVYRVAW